MGILDKVPASIRHALIALAAALIAYAAANYTTWGLSPALYPVIGAAITILGLWATPLTTQYGLFQQSALPVPAADASMPQDTVQGG